MTFEKDAVVLEKNKRLEHFFWALSAVMLVGGIAQAIITRAPPFLLYFLTFPLGFATRVHSDNWRAKPRNARVRADLDGVTVDGVMRASRADITSAVVQPRAGKKPTVRLRHDKRGMLVEIVVEDEAEGVAFLRSIGHDASARKAEFKAMSPVLSTPTRAGLTMAAIMGIIVLAGLSLAHVGKAAGLAMFAVTLIACVGAVIPRGLEIGADGLTLTWHRRRRFVRWDDVRDVTTPGKRNVRLVLTSGKTIELRVASSGAIDSKESSTMRRDAIHQRVLEAIDAHRGRIGPRELAGVLARGDRDETTWLTDLKKLKEGEGGYRAAAVREDDLWRVVEDPGAEEDARAAAAVLLRSNEGARSRLRIAADAVASPKLRVALEAEEEEEAEEALKAFLRREER